MKSDDALKVANPLFDDVFTPFGIKTFNLDCLPEFNLDGLFCNLMFSICFCSAYLGLSFDDLDDSINNFNPDYIII